MGFPGGGGSLSRKHGILTLVISGPDVGDEWERFRDFGTITRGALS